MPSEHGASADQAWLQPDWPAPAAVGALMSTRHGGVSGAPWDSLNLGARVGDAAAAVTENRRRFAERAAADPVWLRQVHGTRVLQLCSADQDLLEADAAWTDRPGLACAVLVADCLPVLFAAPRGVAAAHAGWRGLAAGVLEAALSALCAGTRCAPQDVVAWLGPCIGARSFEVGADVLQAFAGEAAGRFVARERVQGAPRWLADLPGLARDRLRRSGIRQISGDGACTVEQRSRFFSYRRDGITGRMAAAVWLRR